ncbi:MAG: chemotaxis protein CheD [Desulfuromonas sp.]|nr:MAG: chemotaxis protein CheD [Desulfuromonas sp.]
MQTYSVGIAEYQLAQAPDSLTARGLGSCLAIILYDPTRRCGGMAHVLLPTPRPGLSVEQPATYVATGIDVLIEELEASGSLRQYLVAKLVGGSQMFEAFSERVEAIGGRNITAALEAFRELQIPVVAQETGGNFGRSLEFDLASGEVVIKSLRSHVPMRI